MPIEVKLPNLGDDIDSGDVLELLVKEGDTIAKDQGILELETGKATMQVPSPQAGKVLKVHVAQGQTIPPGALLLTLEGAGAAKADSKQAAPPAKEARPAPQEKPKQEKPSPEKPQEARPKLDKPKQDKPQPEPVQRGGAGAPPTEAALPPKESPPKETPAKGKQDKAPAPQPAAQAEAQTESPAEPAHDGDVAAGPAVRRFAREVGVDLSRVAGSGPGGRIIRDDVLAVVRHASQTVAAPAKDKEDATARDNWGPIRVEKMPKIRQTIAARMHESWTTAPRVTNFDDADVTDLDKIRASSKDDYAKKGIKLTSLPFVIKAVATALKSHPAINAAVDLEEKQIIYKQYINIGIAVDTERGLVVPSLRGADQLSIPDIARGLAQLADNVRDGNFSVADLQGSTFTISNLGAIGGTYSTPIINTPEVAILLVGRSRKLPVVLQDDRIEPRLMMPLSLAYDHRLVDGATAARFLNEVIDLLEAPSRLLLAP